MNALVIKQNDVYIYIYIYSLSIYFKISLIFLYYFFLFLLSFFAICSYVFLIQHIPTPSDPSPPSCLPFQSTQPQGLPNLATKCLGAFLALSSVFQLISDVQHLEEIAKKPLSRPGPRLSFSFFLDQLKYLQLARNFSPVLHPFVDILKIALNIFASF